VSWWNPWSWNRDAVERWELRTSGFGRWTLVLVMVGAAVGFLGWFGVSATNDFRLSRHGVVVAATVEDVAPYGKDTQYLLSYVVDGQSERQWSTDVRGLKIGEKLTVIVDRRDRSHFEPTAVFGRRWVLYAMQLLASVVFAALAIKFIRTDAASFGEAARARYGH
jgi:hypothetical protein